MFIQSTFYSSKEILLGRYIFFIFSNKKIKNVILNIVTQASLNDI